MTALHPTESTLARTWPPEAWQDVTLLLAISGGADSVALLRTMTALKTGGPGQIYAAHLNHQLRGDESDQDEAFVRDLCQNLGLDCQVARADVRLSAADAGDGLEAAARAARYDFLRRTAERLGARYVVTAHTADDQAETILHRVIRGTGVSGLAGMSRARPLGPAVTLIRPLLKLHRRELVGYLDDLQQPYRDDSSNRDPTFTRNRIRHRLLPELAAEFNPGVVDALLRLGRLAGEAQSIVDKLVSDLADRCVIVRSPTELEINTAPLSAEPPYLVRELLLSAWRRMDWPLQSMGFTEWDRLAESALAAGDSPAQTLPGNVTAEVENGVLRLERP